MKSALSLIAVLALAGCAADQPPRTQAYSAASASAMTDAVAVEAGSCFRMSQIRNHKKFDDSTLLVEVGRGSVYRWEMGGRCLAGASSSDPLIMTPAAGGDVICRPIDLDLKVKSSGGGFASPCIIKSFVKLTPEQVAALPPKVRP
jgi:hypothetical protein